MAGNLEAERPIRLGMHTYTLHFFGFGESWGFGKDYFFDQVMSLYELMDKADEWGLDGLQITKVDLLATGAKEPFSMCARRRTFLTGASPESAR